MTEPKRDDRGVPGPLRVRADPTAAARLVRHRPAVVMRYMTAPAASHAAGKDTVYFEILGVAWFFLYLRGRLRSGQAGPPLTPLAAGEAAGEAEIANESL